MSFLPCDRCGQPVPGRLINCYIASSHSGNTVRHRTRLCRRHWGLIENDLLKYEIDLVEAAAGRGDMVADCLTCSQPLTEVGWQLFITAYPTQDERKDYWARIHTDCRLPDLLMIDDWSQTSG